MESFETDSGISGSDDRTFTKFVIISVLFRSWELAIQKRRLKTDLILVFLLYRLRDLLVSMILGKCILRKKYKS